MLCVNLFKPSQISNARYLAVVFTKSLNEGVVPQDWLEANVTPIYKKGTKSLPGNYRPVSLTSVSCRVMESILRDEITGHLARNKLIKDSQHGFMKDRSCVSNLLEFLDRGGQVLHGESAAACSETGLWSHSHNI